METVLLRTAHAAIAHEIAHQAPLPVRSADYPLALQAQRATFVTLFEDGALRGCIGSLEARRRLIEDVAENACAAAFRDPRFSPVRPDELGRLDIHISILSPMEDLAVASRQELESKLRPGRDGLVLDDGYHRSTFLPSVWDSLPDPHSFVQHLLLKGGFPTDTWPPTMRVSRYAVTEIPSRQP